MTEGEFLEYIRAKAREQKQAPGTPKRRMPKVSRMESPRMRAASRGTGNTIRAIYQDAKTAGRNTVTGEPEFTTREVGPGDRYNKDYSHGKHTESKRGDGR